MAEILKWRYAKQPASKITPGTEIRMADGGWATVTDNDRTTGSGFMRHIRTERLGRFQDLEVYGGSQLRTRRKVATADTRLPTKPQAQFLRAVIEAGGTASPDAFAYPREATVWACRSAGWLAPYESEHITDGTSVAWPPWIITDAGRAAVANKEAAK